jgi:hypothetical protein
MRRNVSLAYRSVVVNVQSFLNNIEARWGFVGGLSCGENI